jgi:hypothetical protein
VNNSTSGCGSIAEELPSQMSTSLPKNCTRSNERRSSGFVSRFPGGRLFSIAAHLAEFRAAPLAGPQVALLS